MPKNFVKYFALALLRYALALKILYLFLALFGFMVLTNKPSYGLIWTIWHLCDVFWWVI